MAQGSTTPKPRRTPDRDARSGDRPGAHRAIRCADATCSRCGRTVMASGACTSSCAGPATVAPERGRLPCWAGARPVRWPGRAVCPERVLSRRPAGPDTWDPCPWRTGAASGADPVSSRRPVRRELSYAVRAVHTSRWSGTTLSIPVSRYVFSNAGESPARATEAPTAAVCGRDSSHATGVPEGQV